MSLIFQASRQSVAERTRAGVAPPAADTTRTRLAERALVAEADAFAAVRLASQVVATARDRVRQVDRMIAAAGVLGLIGTTAVAIPNPMPLGLAKLVSLVSTLLLLSPLGLALRSALREGARPELAPAEEAAQARAYALIAGRFGRALAPVPSGAGALDPFAPLCALVEGIEADLARLTRPVRAGAEPDRRHRRIVPRQRKVIVKTGDGRLLVGNVKDISVSGLALSERLPRVEVGDTVMVGSHRASVARVWEGGMGLKFESLLDAAALDENLVL